MRVEIHTPESATEPRFWVEHQPVLAMALRSGSIEIGLHRSKMRRFAYSTGEMRLTSHHLEKWYRIDGLHVMTIAISGVALRAAADETAGEVELRSTDNLVDRRVGALAAAVNAERVAGFPSGRLFLDSVEQAIAVALVDAYGVWCGPVRTYRGGLGAGRLRRVIELVHARIEDELTLVEMAQSVELSTAHFAQMFRKSTGETPHQFVLRQRVERAKEMLRSTDARIIDVAVACGFKTQQHFAQVFRQMCGVSPSEYRREFVAR
ncbi:MAG TPA: helix-turn-helix domain-containing protein [Candidatus Acidoferrum sp.]|nr:helix-turn-helix domain-containing protein [Candidatus Acidoferrum sp.]